jgi:hypothetical protein
MRTQKIGELHPGNDSTLYRTRFVNAILKYVPYLRTCAIDECSVHQQLSAPWRSFKEERIKYIDYKSIYDWHQDCSNMAPSELPWFILWSSEEPTEVRDIETKEVYQFKKHDLIYINNLESEHRAPSFNIYGRYVLRYADRNIPFIEGAPLQ